MVVDAATQKRLDAQHEDAFNRGTIPAIVLEVNEFYQKKRAAKSCAVTV